jgi:hypothetical protein
MKVLFLNHHFNYPWDHVTTANWRKYPNPLSPQVQHVDVLSRTIDPKTGILRTERLIACKQPLPNWMHRIFSLNSKEDNFQFAREISEVDPINKTYKAVSTNLTFSSWVTLKETITYRPSAENTTELTQEALVDVDAGVEMIKGWAEEFCVTRFSANAERGRAGLEQVIKGLFHHQEQPQLQAHNM